MPSKAQIKARKAFVKKYAKKKKGVKVQKLQKSKMSAFDRGYKAGYHKASLDLEKYSKQ